MFARANGYVKWRGAVVIYSRRTHPSEIREERVKVPSSSLARICYGVFITQLVRMIVSIVVARSFIETYRLFRVSREEKISIVIAVALIVRVSRSCVFQSANCQLRHAMPLHEITCRYRPLKPLPVPTINPLIHARL